MNKKWLFLFFVFAGYLSCKQNTSTTPNENTTADTTKFFQVNQYIQNQIDEVNKTPYFIYKIDVTNSRRDSTAINTQIFNDIAKRFLKPDINNPDVKKYYSESIFHDETTKNFTINYTTKNKDLELQSVDVLLEEDGQTVKRVFFRKFYSYTDSSAIEQLSWKPDHNFQISRLVQLPGNKESSVQTIVTWNEKS